MGSDLKILVPTDFSEQSEAGLAEAVGWASAQKGRILLLHVISTSYWPLIEDVIDPDRLGLNEELESVAEKRLRAMQTHEIPPGVPSETHVVVGSPAIEISRFARERGVHLVVIATHGHSRLRRFLLGSTTERIVRSAPSPVLVVREGAETSSDSEAEVRGVTGLRRILVATDFSERSVTALVKATEFAKQSDAEIVLLHVLRQADYATREVLSGQIWEDVRQRCQRRLERMQRLHIGDEVRSRVLLTEGVPSARIADAAAEQGVDLVVIASHGHSGIGDFLLGSTTERVVRVAPCSVYVEKDRHAGSRVAERGDE